MISALVAAVLGKDRKVTAEFVARYTDTQYNYIRFRLAPRYDHVECLVQETFLAACEEPAAEILSGGAGPDAIIAHFAPLPSKLSRYQPLAVQRLSTNFC